jgi:hypothetical protein
MDGDWIQCGWRFSWWKERALYLYPSSCVTSSGMIGDLCLKMSCKNQRREGEGKTRRAKLQPQWGQITLNGWMKSDKDYFLQPWAEASYVKPCPSKDLPHHPGCSCEGRPLHMQGETTLTLHFEWIKDNSSISLTPFWIFARILPSLTGVGFMLRSTASDLSDD